MAAAVCAILSATVGTPSGPESRTCSSPDANGGDRASEDKLREIIEAYNYLKSAGLC